MSMMINYGQCILVDGSMVFLLFSMLLIIIQKNPVYAVFSFIVTAFATFLFLLLIGAQFWALLILIIYTGVITVLFLFVVMMYNLRYRNIKRVLIQFFMDPISFIIILKIYWMSIICNSCLGAIIRSNLIQHHYDFYTLDITQFVALFNDHYIAFLFCGLLIFIAMIGSIVITYPFYKHQK